VNKSNYLSQLALAGIAAGMISVAQAAETAAPAAGETPAAVVPDSGKHAKHAKKPKVHKDSTAAAASPAAPAGAPAEAQPKATAPVQVPTGAAAKPAAAPVVMDSSHHANMSDKHGCKGQNACKGKGGCKMSQADLDSAAKRVGQDAAKVGKAHDCKGKNECKGLGGCKGA
jgi:hypothetical protein